MSWLVSICASTETISSERFEELAIVPWTSAMGYQRTVRGRRSH